MRQIPEKEKKKTPDLMLPWNFTFRASMEQSIFVELFADALGAVIANVVSYHLLFLALKQHDAEPNL